MRPERRLKQRVLSADPSRRVGGGGEVKPLHSRREVGDAAFLKRAPKPLVHEALLCLPGFPDLEDDPAVSLPAAGMEQEPGRPVALAAIHVDVKPRVDRPVLLAPDTVEL